MAGITSNAVTIKYGDKTLTSLNVGEKVDLYVDNKTLLSDLQILANKEFVKPSGNYSITEEDNGKTNIPIAGYSTASVNIPIKTVAAYSSDITSNGEYTAKELVKADGISSFYVNVTTKIDDLDNLKELMEIDNIIGEEE